jgi:ubiquinone/menaquinone biosynthesis C-methylase UbiE
MKKNDFIRPERYKEIEDAVKYDKHIRSANTGRRLSHSLEIWALKRALARIEGDEALDAPCGTGRIHRILSNLFSGVVSLDSSDSMLCVHQSKTGSDKLCCGDIFHLPFPDDRFDWCVSYRLFHHMQDHDGRVALLKSLARVSRQGVLFTAWVDTPLNRRRGSRRRSLTKKEIKSVIFDADLHLKRIDFVSWPFQPKCVITLRKFE